MYGDSHKKLVDLPEMLARSLSPRFVHMADPRRMISGEHQAALPGKRTASDRPREVEKLSLRM